MIVVEGTPHAPQLRDALRRQPVDPQTLDWGIVLRVHLPTDDGAGARLAWAIPVRCAADQIEPTCSRHEDGEHVAHSDIAPLGTLPALTEVTDWDDYAGRITKVYRSLEPPALSSSQRVQAAGGELVAAGQAHERAKGLARQAIVDDHAANAHTQTTHGEQGRWKRWTGISRQTLTKWATS